MVSNSNEHSLCLPSPSKNTWKGLLSRQGPKLMAVNQTLFALNSMTGTPSKEHSEFRLGTNGTGTAGVPDTRTDGTFTQAILRSRSSSPPSEETLQWSSSNLEEPPQPPHDRLLARVASLQGSQDALSKMREDVTDFRLYTHHHRNALNQKREAASALDAKLHMTLNSFFALDMTGDTESITSLFEMQREARDALGPAELAYNKLENTLDDKEFALMEAESSFSRRLKRLFMEDDRRSQDTDSVSSASSATSKARSSLAQSASIDEPPAATAYFRRAQDVALIQDELADLKEARTEHLEEEQRLNRVSAPLHQEGRQFLEKFDELYGQAKARLAEAKADAKRLRQIAINDGILAESSSLDSLDSSDDDSVLLRTGEASEYRSSILFPLLDGSDVATTYITQFGDSRDRVNRWILHMLRLSLLQVRGHKAQNSITASLEDRQWTDLALRKWSVDSGIAGRGESHPPAHPTLSSSLPASLSRISPPSLTSEERNNPQLREDPTFIWSRNRSR